MLATLLLGVGLISVPPAASQSEPTAATPVQQREADLLPPAFHEGRRQAVLEALPQDAVAIFFSAPQRIRENDVYYEYRQNSDLYYLTGMREPSTVLLLAPGGLLVDGTRTRELLLVPPHTEYSDTWLGSRLGPEGAEEVLGLEAVSNEQFEEIVTSLAESGRRFYHLPLPLAPLPDSPLGQQLSFFESRAEPLDLESGLAEEAAQIMLSSDSPDTFSRYQTEFESRLSADVFDSALWQEAYRQFVSAPSLPDWQAWRAANITAAYTDSRTLRPLLTRMRMIKTPEEIKLLQKAIGITTEALREAMRSIEPGMYEYEVEALVEYIFKCRGAEHPGFPSIIGSGPNATVLHYESNRRQMQAGDMVVMDVGAEVHGYTADVTRSVPVSGRFSPEQRAIYELVLKAQQAGIEAAGAGQPFRAPGQAARQVIAAGLIELGLIEDPSEVSRYFMHGTSHYLGLYVHDVGTGGPLEAGTVITVEPGIYIRPSAEVDEKWWNIGVRIEDDVLITEGGPEVLSKDAPKSIEAIEALMAETGLSSRQAGLTNGRAPSPRSGER